MPNNIPSPEEILGSKKKIPTPSEILGAPKKKEVTESDMEDGSLDTPKVEKPKPSVSSVSSKGEFTGYPGKEKNRYKIINNEWYDFDKETGSPVKIQNEGRIKALNGYFKQDAYTSQSDKLVKQAEEKLSKILGDDKTDVDVSKSATSKPEYLQIAEAAKSGNKEALAKALENKKTNDVIRKKKELESIEKKKFEDEAWGAVKIPFNNEEDFAEEMNKRFNKHGFYFEETGFGDRVIGKYSPDGGFTITNEVEFTPDNITQDKFLFFMDSKLSKSEAEALTVSGGKTDEERKKNYYETIKVRMELMSENPDRYGKDLISEGDAAKVINREANILTNKSNQLSKEYQELSRYVDEYEKSPTPEGRLFIKNKSAELGLKEISIAKGYDDLNRLEKNFNSALTVYKKTDEEKGTFIGNLGSNFVSGVTNLERMITEKSIDLLPYVEDLVSGDVDFSDNDKKSKQLKRDILPNLEEGLLKIGSLGTTTEEYKQSKDRGVIETTLGFLAESIGTAISAGGNPTLAKAAFFAQSYNSIKKEMRGEDFDGMSEAQKELIAVPYAMTIGVLEKLGFKMSSSLAKKGVSNTIINGIVRKTFTSLPKGSSREVIESAIEKNILAAITDKALKITSGGVIEGVTEGIQEYADVATKDLANYLSDHEYFKGVPLLNTADGFIEASEMALKSFGYGMLGGNFMTGGSMVKEGIKSSILEAGLDSRFTEDYKNIMNEGYRDSEKESVNISLRNGEITQEEADNKKKEIDDKYVVYSQLSDDLFDKSVKKARQAAELIKEKNEITAAIEGKDKALVTAKTDRINAINEELAKLGQDETADITTDGDVQSRVEPSDTQREGANVQETVEPTGSEGEVEEITKDATKESTEQQQEIPTESNIAERQGVNEGQQEVWQTEGGERETTQPEANISDSNISSETEVIPSIETKIDEYEQRTENEVVTPNTETTKTKKAKSIERTRKALDVETNDLQDLVKKHFISGGRIDAIAVTQALFGNKGSKSVAGEYRKRVGLHKKGGLTIDGLANLLWGENADILGENITTRDWRNAIEEVLTSEGSTNDMIESLLAKTEEPLTDLEAKYWESKYDMNAIEGFDEFELMDAESVLDNMTDQEMAQMLSEIEQSELEEYNYNEEVQQSTGQKALDWISAINSKLDEIIDPKNLNDATRVIPAIALKTILKALEVSIKAGMTVSKAVDKYFNENTEYTKEQFEATISRVPTVKSIISQSAKSQKRAFKQGKREGREETEAKLKPVIEKLRDLKKDRDAARAYILDQIKEFEGKKVLNARAVLNRLMRVNLNNATAVDNFIEYAEKAFKNAAYVDRVNAIIKMNKASKKNSKNQSVSIKSVAKRLANIDPVMVEDLDMFEEMSIKLNAATRKGDKTPINIKEATDYMEKVEAEIKEKQRLNLLGEFAELVDDGIIDKNATYEDIMAIIKGIESSDEVSNDTIEEKKAELKNKFENQKIAAQQAVRVSQTELAKAKIVEALDIDIDKLSISDAYLLVTAVDNFIENDIADNLGPLVDKYRGLDNAAKAKQSGLKAKGFMSLNRVMNNAFAAIPVVVDSMFGSVKKGSDILRLSAYNALARGAVLANRMTERVVDQYTAKFKKTTPNGERFTSVQNIYERGLLANLLRSIDDDTQIQSDFDTKKNLMLQSVAKLLNSKSKTERLKGKAYTELFEKVGLEEATNVDELNIDKVNRAAVNFWIKEWSNHYDKLAEVNQVYHNSILEADRNYTPIRTTAFQGTRSQDIETVGSMFSVEMGVDKNKSGVLMENTRPKNIKDRYIDLDFDASNVRALNAALLDIHTSESAIQMDAFINSRDFDSLFEKVEDREMITSRFKNYANRARKKEAFQKGIGSVAFDKTINGLSGWGTSLVLGGLSQVPKQTISVLSNTIINAGPGNFVLLSPWGNSDMNKWIERNDLTITARGMSSRTTYEKADKILEAGGSSDSKLRKLNDFYLETFLGNADIYAARSSFMSYYIQSLKRQGELSRDIDWDNHEVNQQASEYAQHMVDRQQNVSDNAAAGEVFASNNVGLKIIRKTLLPFSTFIMNQKARMVSDIRALSDVSNNTPEERFTALRSLTGAVVEISMFVVISEFIKSGYGMVADKMAEAFGIEGGDDEEDKNKDEKRQRERGVKQAIKDILSPIPLLDNVILSGIDTALDYLQNLTDVSDDKEFKDALAKKEEAEGELSKIALESFKTSWREEREYRFSDNFVEGIFSDLGVLGISAGALKDLFDTGKKLDSHMVTVDQYGRKSEKYITNNAMNLQYTSFGLQLGHAVGIFPSDVRAIQRKVQKTIDKSALTLKQYEVYKELKEDVSDREVMLLRKSFDAIDIEDVRDAEKTLSDKQMDTYFKAVAKSPSKLYIDNMLISDIKKGMSAEAIVKKYND